MKTTLTICLSLLVALSSQALAQTTPTHKSGTAKPAATQPSKKPADEQSATANNSSSEQEPETLILSDTLAYDDVTKTSIFKGNVILTRGLMRLQSDELHITEDAQGNRKGVATMNSGKLVKIIQEQPEEYTVTRAEGSRGEYDGLSDVTILIGKANVTRYVCGVVVDNVRGDKVLYNNSNNTYQAIGGKNSAAPSGRVRSFMKPRDIETQAVEQCRQKYNNKPMPSTIQTSG